MFFYMFIAVILGLNKLLLLLYPEYAYRFNSDSNNIY